MQRAGLIILLILSAHLLSAKQGIDVTVKGITPYNDKLNSDEMKKMALRDAYFKAVENAVGVYIQKTTSIKNYKDIVDISLTRSRGYVRSFQEISSGVEESNYQVTIKALVEEGSFLEKEDREAFVLFTQVVMGNPTVYILASVDEKVSLEHYAITSKFIEQLTEYGFQIIDKKEVIQASNYQKQNLAESENSVIMESLSDSINCDFVLLLSVNSDENDEYSDESLSGLTTINLLISIRLLLAESNKIIFSDTQQIPGIGISKQQAEYIALQKYSKSIKTRFIDVIPKTIVDYPLEIRLKISNVTSEKLVYINNEFQNLPYSISIILESWQDHDNQAFFIIYMDSLGGSCISIWNYILGFIDEKAKLLSLKKRSLEVILNN